MADDILGEKFKDLARTREFAKTFGNNVLKFIVDDLVTKVDALVADVDTWTSDELLNLLLALSAERTLEHVACFSNTCHEAKLNEFI